MGASYFAPKRTQQVDFSEDRFRMSVPLRFLAIYFVGHYFLATGPKTAMMTSQYIYYCPEHPSL